MFETQVKENLGYDESMLLRYNQHSGYKKVTCCEITISGSWLRTQAAYNKVILKVSWASTVLFAKPFLEMDSLFGFLCFLCFRVM